MPQLPKSSAGLRFAVLIHRKGGWDEDSNWTHETEAMWRAEQLVDVNRKHVRVVRRVGTSGIYNQKGERIR